MHGCSQDNDNSFVPCVCVIYAIGWAIDVSVHPTIMGFRVRLLNWVSDGKIFSVVVLYVYPCFVAIREYCPDWTSKM